MENSKVDNFLTKKIEIFLICCILLFLCSTKGKKTFSKKSEKKQQKNYTLPLKNYKLKYYLSFVTCLL